MNPRILDSGYFHNKFKCIHTHTHTHTHIYISIVMTHLSDKENKFSIITLSS